MSTLKPTLLKTRRDSVDIDNLGELEIHNGYRMVAARVTKTIEQCASDLKHAESWETSLRLQGQIQAFEVVLGLPATLIKEIREALRQEGRQR